jgi:hypothetical protein
MVTPLVKQFQYEGWRAGHLLRNPDPRPYREFQPFIPQT